MSKRDLFLGVDPGVSGSMCVIDSKGTYIAHIKNAETYVDQADWLAEYGEDVVLCVVENVSSSPQMGVRSAFTFGRAYGFVEGVIVYCRIPMEKAAPTKWMTAMKCRTGGDKNVTKSAAQSLHPKLKVTHAFADALLIAEYARRLAIERRLF